VESACRVFGPPRVLVNNAGWTRVDSFLNSTEEFRRTLIDINFLAPARVTHAVAKLMVDKKVPDARIIFVSSDAGRVGSGGEAVYAGAKGGLISFAKSLAREFARYGITVNAVAPGPIDTRLYQQMDERRKEAIIRGIPMRKVGRPVDVAGAVAFFADPTAAYVTGQVVSVSGGLTMAG
jgi:2-hydroxycyclohexanecarboxyl-CoA dehydrogenase